MFYRVDNKTTVKWLKSKGYTLEKTTLNIEPYKMYAPMQYVSDNENIFILNSIGYYFLEDIEDNRNVLIAYPGYDDMLGAYIISSKEFFKYYLKLVNLVVLQYFYIPYAFLRTGPLLIQLPRDLQLEIENKEDIDFATVIHLRNKWLADGTVLHSLKPTILQYMYIGDDEILQALQQITSNAGLFSLIMLHSTMWEGDINNDIEKRFVYLWGSNKLIRKMITIMDNTYYMYFWQQRINNNKIEKYALIYNSETDKSRLLASVSESNLYYYALS